MRCRKLAARLGCRALDVAEPQVRRTARTTGQSSRTARGPHAADEDEEHEEEDEEVGGEEEEEEDEEEQDEIGPSQLHDAPQPSQGSRPRRVVKQPDRWTPGQVRKKSKN